jgi:hypothetical protein
METTYAAVAFRQLKDAGHEVTPADGIPGLWDIAGIARDVTTGQLMAIANERGATPIRYPMASILPYPGS